MPTTTATLSSRQPSNTHAASLTSRSSCRKAQHSSLKNTQSIAYPATIHNFAFAFTMVCIIMEW